MSKTMREIVAGTRWVVEVTRRGDAYLLGDDFTHDVALEVTGDFPAPGDHLAYAQALADRLNGGAK